MLKQVERAVKKYFNFRTFYLLFLLEAAMILGSLLFVETAARLSSSCKTSEINISGKLAANDLKAYEFNYDGEDNCYLLVLPEWDTRDGISLWLYEPNGDVEVLDVLATPDKKAIELSETPKGKYRISIHNRNGKEVEYKLKIFLAAQ